MGPLIDTELERVDRKHAQLTQLSSDLVEALNLYHSLMREPAGPGPSFIQKPGNYGYMPHPNHPVHQPQVIFLFLLDLLHNYFFQLLLFLIFFALCFCSTMAALGPISHMHLLIFR